jgi:hypothetical protein
MTPSNANTDYAALRLPDDHPLIVAWEAYRATEAYPNTLDWAMKSSDKMIVEGSLWTAFAAGAARIETLEAQVLSLEKDAARYRWLRSVGPEQSGLIHGELPCEEHLDAAIDAALTRSTEEK